VRDPDSDRRRRRISAALALLALGGRTARRVATVKGAERRKRTAAADRLVITDYDMPVALPTKVIGLLYDFLEEPRFEHDFEAVEYDAAAFDAQLGLDGLHRVRPRVAPQPRQTTLPPDLFDRFAGLTFRTNLAHCRAVDIVVQPGLREPGAVVQPTVSICIARHRVAECGANFLGPVAVCSLSH